MLTHPTHSRLVTLGLTGMAKAPDFLLPLVQMSPRFARRCRPSFFSFTCRLGCR
jgi:hypothetical protein